MRYTSGGNLHQPAVVTAVVAAAALLALFYRVCQLTVCCTKNHLHAIASAVSSADAPVPNEGASLCRLPCGVVDLDAFERNVGAMVGALVATRKHIRIATKSVRCESLLRIMTSRIPPRNFAGLMTFTARESVALAKLRCYRHILLAYPIASADDAKCVVESNASPLGHTPIAVMVDCQEQLTILLTAIAGLKAVTPTFTQRVWLDVDMSWSPLSCVHVGVRRSPITDPSSKYFADLVRSAAAHPLKLEGIMGYEAQVAGLPDTPSPLSCGSVVSAVVMRPLRKVVKAISQHAVRSRRAMAVASARRISAHPVECNGGGSGSIRSTCCDESVTEVTIGSGALCGHLFDGYDDPSFEPALFFALRITRISVGGRYATCHGGGWIASGAASGADRVPLPVYPCGAALVPLEGCGEVQTPLRIPASASVSVGDVALFRPAKSGELGDILEQYILVRSSTATVAGAVQTYRGASIPTW